MAQKVSVTLTDDLDGKEADETVLFGLDGIAYEIDLSTKNAAGLRNALTKYVGAARKVGKSSGSARKSASARSGPNPKDVRAWAKAQGLDVPARGRLPVEVTEQYEAAQKNGKSK